MRARRLNREAPGGARIPLKDVLPLATPYVVQFFPIYACNFRCTYCHFSIPAVRRPFITEKKVMEPDLLLKCVDDLAEFPDKIKTLRFVGMGEPLLHGDLAAMVEYAKRKNVANTVEVLSNGSLLQPELADALIRAGLDRLVVSLQGTSAEKYQAVSGVAIDFSEFLTNLTYFYRAKKNTHVYFKIVDSALDGPEDEERFFRIFGNICDSINIEHTVPIYPGVDYGGILRDSGQLSQFGLEVGYAPICPRPYYFMQVNPDGEVAGCDAIPFPQSLGNAHDKALREIWNGNAYNGMRYRMLDGRDKYCALCRDCTIMNLRLFPEDDLAAAAGRLKEKFLPVPPEKDLT